MWVFESVDGGLGENIGSPDNMISVVVPVYNGSRYIADTVQSVLNQTLSDWELIISDDGSVDGTVDVVKGFNDPRISVISADTNRGVAVALNSGIKASQGSFVALLGGDDLLTTDSLAVRLATMCDNDLVCGQAVDICYDATLAQAYDMLLKTPARCRYFYGPGVMMRRDTFSRCGLFDERLRYRVDREMWVRLFGPDRTRIDRASFICLQAIVGYYRIRPDSMQRTFETLPDLERLRALYHYELVAARRQKSITRVEFL